MTSICAFQLEIHEAKSILNQLEGLKKATIGPFDGNEANCNPKIVWKFDGYLQAALYRTTNIAEDALDMWQRVNPISAVILARSLMETVSAAYWLISRAKRKIIKGNLDSADEDVSNLSFAAKSINDLPEAKNVMTYIDSVEKMFPGFRNAYALLSEASHPNHLGTLGAYSDLDEESCSFTFFNKHPEATAFLEKNMPFALSGSLKIMQITLTEYHSIRPDLAKLAQL